MSALFSLSKPPFVRLLGFVFMLSLFHVGTTTNSTKRKDLCLQKKTKLTCNDDSAQNPTAVDSTNSPTHKPSYSSQSEVPQDKDSAKGNALEESLQSAISGNLVALKNSASLLPIGVEVELVEGKFQLKLNGYSMNYDNMANALSYIHKQFKSFRLGSISISNLPLSEINARIIRETIGCHPELDKFSISNCFLNESEFFREFTILSLTELELDKCNRIEEILEKTNNSLQVLQLTNNSISLNFGQLTELLKKFTNLKKLTLDGNGIDITGFEIFFDFVFSLKELKELHFVNDGVPNEFLRLLSEREKVSFPLKNLTLLNQTKTQDYENFDGLAKLELQTLSISLKGDNGFYENLSKYLSQGKTLERIVYNYPPSYFPPAFELPLLPFDNIIFDLSNIRNNTIRPKNIQQLSNITRLCVNSQNSEELKSLLNSVHFLPNLVDLTWYNEEMDLSILTNKTPNLESLSIGNDSFGKLLHEKFFNENRFFPKLKSIKFFHYQYEPYFSTPRDKNDNLLKFFHANPSIKTIDINHAFLSDSFYGESKLSEEVCFKYIEEMILSYDSRSNYFALYHYLQFFPNLKILSLESSGYDLGEYDVITPIEQIRPTKIEQLTIIGNSDRHRNRIPLEDLLTLIPNVKTLSFEGLSRSTVSDFIDSLKNLTQLTRLEMDCCQFGITKNGFLVDRINDIKEKEENDLIREFIMVLVSLEHLVEVKMKLLYEEYNLYYKEFAAVILPFSKKRIIISQESKIGF